MLSKTLTTGGLCLVRSVSTADGETAVFGHSLNKLLQNNIAIHLKRPAEKYACSQSAVRFRLIVFYNNKHPQAEYTLDKT